MEEEGNDSRRIGAHRTLQSRHTAHLDVDIRHTERRTIDHTDIVGAFHGLDVVGATQDVGATVLQLGIEHLQRCGSLRGDDLEVVLRLPDLAAIGLQPAKGGLGKPSKVAVIWMVLLANSRTS